MIHLPKTRQDFFKLAVAIGVSLSAGAIGSIFTAPAIPIWYAGLVKPALNPPAWVFGPVWTVLYVLIGISFYLVWKENFRTSHRILEDSRKPWNRLSRGLWTGRWQKFNAVSIFALQLILNVSWSFVFFGLFSPPAAFFVLSMLWVAIVFTIINFYRVSKLSAWLLLPYIFWVSFAGYLNFMIWTLNWL